MADRPKEHLPYGTYGAKRTSSGVARPNPPTYASHVVSHGLNTAGPIIPFPSCAHAPAGDGSRARAGRQVRAVLRGWRASVARMSEAKSGDGPSGSRCRARIPRSLSSAALCADPLAPSRPRYRTLAFKRARHRIGVFCDDRQQYLRGLVGAVGTLFPITHRPER